MKEKKPHRMPQDIKAAKTTTLPEEDMVVWGLATSDVTQLGIPNKVTKPLRGALKKRSFTNVSGQITLESFSPQITSHHPSSFQVDGALKKRFEKGDISIDGKIDLHGLTLPQAHSRFMQFIAHQIQNGSRCLLVITGKGSQESENGRGILRKNLPLWCEDAQVKPHILQFTTAEARHGGNGAYYILLRRRK